MGWSAMCDFEMSLDQCSQINANVKNKFAKVIISTAAFQNFYR